MFLLILAVVSTLAFLALLASCAGRHLREMEARTLREHEAFLSYYRAHTRGL